MGVVSSCWSERLWEDDDTAFDSWVAEPDIRRIYIGGRLVNKAKPSEEGVSMGFWLAVGMTTEGVYSVERFLLLRSGSSTCLGTLMVLRNRLAAVFFMSNERFASLSRWRWLLLVCVVVAVADRSRDNIFKDIGIVSSKIGNACGLRHCGRKDGTREEDLDAWMTDVRAVPSPQHTLRRCRRRKKNSPSINVGESDSMENLVSVSSAPIARLGNKKYYDLLGTLRVLSRVFRASAVDGFELQLEPEWDEENPPLTDVELADWKKTPKFTNEGIMHLVKEKELPVLSVHASRDIGNYLCSSRKRDLEKGKRLIRDSLSLAESLGAGICVFHLWDTWRQRFDLNNLRKIFLDLTTQFSKVKASVENIPTHLKGQTPFTLVEQFDYITLDLRWAALYDELDKFESLTGKLVNVHLRGKLVKDSWVLDNSSFSFYDALEKIRGQWKYSGLLTVEPEGGVNVSSYDSFIMAMKSIKIDPRARKEEL